MSNDIKEKLSEARDQIRELQYAYDSLQRGGTYGGNNFTTLMDAFSDFITNHIDDVYSAVDEAVDEIVRIDTENDDLLERIDELEKQIEQLEEEKE